ADTISAGMYLLHREALAGFGPGPVSFERQVFPSLAEQGKLKAVVTDGLWLDIGTPALYLAAHGLVLQGGCRLHRVPGRHVQADGSQVAGELRGAWSWIGPGAVVEEGAVVKEAVVLDGARLHGGSRVERAVVGWDSQVLPGALVRDFALVGEGCRIGPECELAGGVRVAPGARLGLRWISFSPPP
ncbi:MAG: NDP-sugar synthase, partial [Acidimicrobiia bacterium]